MHLVKMEQWMRPCCWDLCTKGPLSGTSSILFRRGKVNHLRVTISLHLGLESSLQDKDICPVGKSCQHISRDLHWQGVKTVPEGSTEQQVFSIVALDLQQIPCDPTVGLGGKQSLHSHWKGTLRKLQNEPDLSSRCSTEGHDPAQCEHSFI